MYRAAEATERYPIATQLRPTQQNHQGNQQTSGTQQNPQAIQTNTCPQERRLSDQQPTFVQQNPCNSQEAGNSDQSCLDDQQPILAYNSGMGSFEQEFLSVPQLQQSRFATPMPGDFSSGGGSTAMSPQEQPYFHTPQHGSIQGFGLNSVPAPESYLGQGNNMMFDSIVGSPIQPLPQIHRPVFDGFGYIVGEQASANDGGLYGGNLYDDEMYRSKMSKDFGHSRTSPLQVPQQVHGTDIKSDPQLSDAPRSFYSFVTNNLDENENDQGEHGQQEDGQEECDKKEYEPEEDGPEEDGPEEDGPGEGDQDGGTQIGDDQDHIGAEEEEIQDEGVAMGNTGREDANSPNTPQGLPKQRPEIPPPEVLWARERSPYRFLDRTGTGICDYCDRLDHEAYACLKWDPDHYDKPVCTACNNKEHSLDECSKFRAMSFAEKQALLVVKGAGRPGVRSQYHAWTRYVVHGATGLPLTRRFLQDLSNSPSSDAADTWKEWDYGQGVVPAQFRDSVAEVLAADDPLLVDERFMDGNHGFGRKAHPEDNL